MPKKIVQMGNKILESPSNEADFNSSEVKTLISDMLEVLNEIADKSAGLSAPQIGVGLRVAICRRMDLEAKAKQEKVEPTITWEVMINPTLIEKSEKHSIYWEGCLSINEGNLFGQVSRPANVTVEYLDEKGNKKVLKAKGYFSHIVQHELDHLNGILFTKYVSDPTKLYTSEELSKLERKE